MHNVVVDFRFFEFFLLEGKGKTIYKICNSLLRVNGGKIVLCFKRERSGESLVKINPSPEIHTGRGSDSLKLGKCVCFIGKFVKRLFLTDFLTREIKWCTCTVILYT